MLHFENLALLEKHQKYLTQILNTSDFFIVGGSIRDILLGIKSTLDDIDITMSGNPDDIREHMKYDKNTISRFHTEKFGTITLIPKENNHINYEITPLRTEGNYEDFRHPGEIHRSSDILLDSQRRDFTINCIYRYTTQISLPTTLEGNTSLITDDSFLIKKLKQHKNICLTNTQTIILQDHDTIKQLFKEGVFQKSYFQKLLPTLAFYSTEKGGITNKNILTTTYSFLIDPFYGIQDLIHRKICTVGNPDKRFTEDALRIIRGVRFPNILNQKIVLLPKQNGFNFEKKTRESMQKNAVLIKHLAKERLHGEIIKVFKEENPFGYISLLNELGLLETLFPALAGTKGNNQPTRYHTFDTFNHILLTLYSLQKINSDYLLKLAMLYHDVGKPEQYAYISEQKNKNPENPDMTNYVHHTESGLPLAKKDLQKLGCTKKEIETVLRYIRWHHRPHEILESKEKKRNKKIRKMISEGGIEKVVNLMDMVIADRLGQYNPLQDPAIEEIKELKSLAQKIYNEEGRFRMGDMNIDGNLIIEKCNIKAGPHLGKILQQCFNWVIGDIKQRNNQKEILQYIKQMNNKGITNE